MSVRAYRVNSKDIEKDNSFNLWHDEKIMDFLEDGGYLDNYNENGGSLCLSVEALEQIIEEIKDDKEYESRVESIKNDIKWAKEKKDTEIEYECY